jgi:hypothetical protein
MAASTSALMLGAAVARVVARARRMVVVMCFIVEFVVFV